MITTENGHKIEHVNINLNGYDDDIIVVGIGFS